MEKIIGRGYHQYIFNDVYFTTMDNFKGIYIYIKKNQNPLKIYKRLINFALINLQGKLKTSYVFGYPLSLILDPCSKCVLHCPICPTGIGDNSRSRGLMKYGDFYKLMGEIGDYLLQIDLVNWGEPLLNDRIFGRESGIG